jgi:trigger factor
VGKGGVLKDFEDALVGMATGETKEFPVAFPADYPKAELAGKTARFTATVREVKEKVLPRVDDAFAKDAFHCADVADLRARIAEDLKARAEAEQRGRMTDQMAERLIALHAFDVPPSLVDQEQQRLATQAVERFRSQGVDPSQWPEERRKDFVTQFRAPAERNVRMSMVVERIAEAEGVRCLPEDLDRHLERLSKALGQPKESVRRYLDQDHRKDEVEDRIVYEKTLDLLIENAKVEVE